MYDDAGFHNLKKALEEEHPKVSLIISKIGKPFPDQESDFAQWLESLGEKEAKLIFDQFRIEQTSIIKKENEKLNHDHAIVRDPLNDYGEDWLGIHLNEQHPSQQQVMRKLGLLPSDQ